MADKEENIGKLGEPIELSLKKDEAAKKILEGISVDQLPDSLEFGTWLSDMDSEIMTAVLQHKAKSSSIFEKARKRLRDHYLSQGNVSDDDKQHLTEQEMPMSAEFSLRIYSANGSIVKGKIHKGLGSVAVASFEPGADGFPDEQAIVKVHSHPTNSGFSRGDFMVMLSNDQTNPEKCLYPVITPDYTMVTFNTTESPRLEGEELRAIFNAPKSKIEEMEIANLERYKLLEELNLPAGVDDDTKDFATTLLDAVKVSEMVHVPVYLKKKNQKNLTRIKTAGDIVNFLELDS